MKTSLTTNCVTHGLWLTNETGLAVYNNKQHGQVIGYYRNGTKPNSKAHDVALAVTPEGKANLQYVTPSEVNANELRIVEIPIEDVKEAIEAALFSLLGKHMDKIEKQKKVYL